VLSTPVSRLRPVKEARDELATSELDVTEEELCRCSDHSNFQTLKKLGDKRKISSVSLPSQNTFHYSYFVVTLLHKNPIYHVYARAVTAQSV